MYLKYHLMNESMLCREGHEELYGLLGRTCLRRKLPGTHNIKMRKVFTDLLAIQRPGIPTTKAVTSRRNEIAKWPGIQRQK